jgi:hypothetical protein
MGRTTWLPPKPPIFEDEVLNLYAQDLFNYITEIHRVVFGLGAEDDGDIDVVNAPGFHSGDTGGHASLEQATDVDNKTLSSLQINEPDANAVYGAEEAALINELKEKFNLHITEFNTGITNDNEEKQSLRDANILV